jgi:uncharacterized HhH-GPD family protein
MPATTPTLAITGDPDADRLLVEEPLALVLGMLLDQQVPMEWAFKGPATLKARLGGRLDAHEIASMSEDAFVAVCSEKPAIHRFPRSMGARAHQLCRSLVDEYDGDAAAVWAGAKTGAELLGRVEALPGFGTEKSKIFVAMLAKRFGVTPRGWKAAVAPFSDAVPRSVADIDSPAALARVREWKKAQKAAGRSKQDSPSLR